jgi:hypothetical protein
LWSQEIVLFGNVLSYIHKLFSLSCRINLRLSLSKRWQWRVRLDYRDEKAIVKWVELHSKTQVQGIYLTHRTATERENLRIWARDSLAMRRGALRCGEHERCGAHYGLCARVIVSADTR